MALTHEIVVALDGVFDLVAARRIEEALAMVRAGGILAVDLSRVVEFQALGLAALAATVRQSGSAVHIVLRGLRQHQLRLLHYMGVDGRAPGGATLEG